MLLVIKVAANLTRGWRMAKTPGLVPAFGGAGYSPIQQERSLVTGGAPATSGATTVASDRVRSTVASLETMSASHRLPPPAAARLAMPAPVPQLSLAGPSDARSQLRYLHHRVSGASTPVSREMLR